MSRKKIRVKLNKPNVQAVCLKSDEVCDLIDSLGKKVAINYGKNATVDVSKAFGNRAIALVYAPYVEASKNNELLKALRND